VKDARGDGLTVAAVIVPRQEGGQSETQEDHEHPDAHGPLVADIVVAAFGDGVDRMDNDVDGRKDQALDERRHSGMSRWFA